LAEGWQHLRERAGQALTRFGPLGGRGDLDTWEDQVIRHSADWGLLATEVQEDEHGLTVRLEVPGMDRENFDIDVVEGYLVVRGEKRLQQEQRQGRFHVMECAYGSFERAIPLPDDVQADAARASYTSGVLRIELPKPSARRRKRVSVSVS